MTLTQFKIKYFTYSFYWVDESNYETLQRIAQNMGLDNHLRDGEIWKFIISKHEVQRNLVMFPTGYYQSTLWHIPDHEYGDPVDYEKMLEDYRNIINPPHNHLKDV